MTYSHLNYSDDYDLDVIVSTTSVGRKIVFNKRKVVVESKVRVKGSLLRPYVYPLKVTGKTFSVVEVSSSYHGSIGITIPTTIIGSLITETSSKYTVKGTSKIGVSEKVYIKGQKDYTSIIGVLNKYISNNSEPSIIEGYTKLITSYPSK